MAPRRKTTPTKPTIPCIYCGQHKAPDREHVIPRNLGTYRNLKHLTRHVCRDCNGALSPLDQIFARTGPEALFRHIARVSGRRYHRPVNPFYYHLNDQGGLRVMGKHPEYPFDVLWEPQPGPGREATEARQIVFKVRGRYDAVALPQTGVRDFLKEQIHLRKLEDAEPVCFFAGDAEDDPEHVEVRQALDDLCEKKGTTKPVKTSAGHVITVRAAFDITRDYLRAVTKVAFHYFLLQQPRFTGAEPIFEAARRFITNGENFDNQCRLVPPITEEVLRIGGLSNWTHFLAGEITYDEFAVRVQLFVGPDTVPPTWRVRLARNPSPIHQYTEAFRHKFMLFAQPAADGFQGEMLPLSAATAVIKPGLHDVAIVTRSRPR